MLIVPEATVPDLLSIEDAIEAVEGIYKAMDQGEARVFPVVRESLGCSDAVFGIKSGFVESGANLGLKAGGYWPRNQTQGRSNHQSIVALFDGASGVLDATVSGNYLTAVRTAAATAISVKYLARPESMTLGIVGAGAQAQHQLRAVASVCAIKRVLAWNRTPDKVHTLQRQLADIVPVESAGLEVVARQSDILITITSSREQLIRKHWVRPGTHIAAAGADTIGKQELDPALVASSKIFVDHATQARTIGECQHAYQQGLVSEEETGKTIGAVLSHRIPARQSSDEITLFDNTGVALQDLAVARLIVARARQRGAGIVVDL